MLHRLVVTAAASLTVLAATPALAHADTGPLDLPALLAGQDSLTVTVSDSDTGVNGTYRLECSPDGGTHPNAAGACQRLKQLAADGQNPFVATPERSICTLMYGGPATAHITGTWQGRQVNGTFRRTNGCEVRRWNELVPVLPSVGMSAGPSAGPSAMSARSAAGPSAGR